MKTKLFILMAVCLSCFGRASAQWVVTDPSNLAQGIINTAKQIVQTSTTANNVMSNFKETQKIFQQGKEYYDALKKYTILSRAERKYRKAS